MEKNLNTIFDKLKLSHTNGYSRRVLAVLRHLESNGWSKTVNEPMMIGSWYCAGL